MSKSKKLGGWRGIIGVESGSLLRTDIDSPLERCFMTQAAVPIAIQIEWTTLRKILWVNIFSTKLFLELT